MRFGIFQGLKTVTWLSAGVVSGFAARGFETASNNYESSAQTYAGLGKTALAATHVNLANTYATERNLFILASVIELGVGVFNGATMIIDRNRNNQIPIAPPVTN